MKKYEVWSVTVSCDSNTNLFVPSIHTTGGFEGALRIAKEWLKEAKIEKYEIKTIHQGEQQHRNSSVYLTD